MRPSDSDCSLRVLVDPDLKRQLDPRGVALLWSATTADGLLVISSVCDEPDCEARDVQIWAIPVSRSLVAVEADARGRVELVERLPEVREVPSSRRAGELYALVDVDDGSVRAHPAFVLGLEACRLLQRFRAEVDPELRAYLRSRFDDVRGHVKRRRPRSRRAKPRSVGRWAH